MKGFVAAGGKLKPSDTDLTTVSYTVTSIGKNAALFAVSVLPPKTGGILSIGRQNADGSAYLSFAMCHATLTGVEGMTILGAIRDTFK